MSEDNKQALSRLLDMQLDADGIGPEEFARKRLDESRRSSFFNWRAGRSKPQAEKRAELEDALGWKRGSVTKILGAAESIYWDLKKVQLPAPEDRAALKAAELSTDELLIELTRRVGAMRDEVEFLRGKAPTRPMFDLAADSTAAGRNMEHLEGDDSR